MEQTFRVGTVELRVLDEGNHATHEANVTCTCKLTQQIIHERWRCLVHQTVQRVAILLVNVLREQRFRPKNECKYKPKVSPLHTFLS
jgi:hypothetical protein